MALSAWVAVVVDYGMVSLFVGASVMVVSDSTVAVVVAAASGVVSSVAV